MERKFLSIIALSLALLLLLPMASLAQNTISYPKPIVSSTMGNINGHEYVDLGLSVKWATCNVGASSPGDYGSYFAWGEMSTKSEYTKDNSKTYKKESYNRDIGGALSLDAARANWGGTWRLPTAGEFLELINNCAWEWTTYGGHKGMKVTSNMNGKSIFLPAAGWWDGASQGYAGENGYYWSSSPYEDDSIRTRRLHFNSGGHSVNWGYRYRGRSVRPVSE